MRIRGIIGGFFLLLVFTIQSHAADTQKNYEIALTKGIYAIETGDFGSAVTELERALSIKPDDRDAQLALGVAHARSGDNVKAKEILAVAAEKHPEDARIKYELGVVLYRLGESEKAGEYFIEIGKEESGAGEEMKEASQSYVEILASRQEPEEKTYALHLLGGFQYDSNVVLEATNPVRPADRKADWRTILSLDARWNFLNTRAFSGKAQYSLYQSIHNKLNDFNIHQHTVMLSGTWNISEMTHLLMRYKLAYSLAGGDEYSASNAITAAFRIVFTPKVITELEYSHQFNNYFNSDAFIANADRSGDRDIIGISQRVGLGESTGLALSYHYDMDRTDTAYWDYNGHLATIQLNTSYQKMKAFLSASFHDRKYQDTIPGYTDERHDGVQEYSLNIVFPVSKRISITVGEIYVINNSNIEFYDYKRSITGILAVLSL